MSTRKTKRVKRARRAKNDRGRGPGMTYLIILATDAQKVATKKRAKRAGLSLSNYMRKRLGFPAVKAGRKVRA